MYITVSFTPITIEVKKRCLLDIQLTNILQPLVSEIRPCGKLESCSDPKPKSVPNDAMTLPSHHNVEPKIQYEKQSLYISVVGLFSTFHYKGSIPFPIEQTI